MLTENICTCHNYYFIFYYFKFLLVAYLPSIRLEHQEKTVSVGKKRKAALH